MNRRRRRTNSEILITVADFIAELPLDEFHSIREISLELGLTWRSTRVALRTLSRIGLASFDGEKNRKKYGRAWAF